MRVLIEGQSGVVLDVGVGAGVLLPLDPNERTEAFEALTGALAMLAGITKLGAKEGGGDQRSAAKGQSGGHRKSGVVVPLRSP